MRGKSYLAMGGVSMGIAGSIVDQALFENYLGMRVETIDMTEILRPINRGIYDEEEFQRALQWVKSNCPEGKDYNSPETTRSRAQLDSEWETSVKMALIGRDLITYFEACSCSSSPCEKVEITRGNFVRKKTRQPLLRTFDTMNP